MSLSVFDQPLRLSIRPSPCLRRVQLLAHVAAGIGLAISAHRADMPWNFLLWGFIGLLIPSYLYVNKALRRWTGLVWIPNGEIRLLGEERCEACSATLDQDSFISPWLVVLALRSGTRRIRVPLCRDATEPDGYRRLRVLLRQGRVDEDAASYSP